MLGVTTLPAVQAPLHAASGVWRNDGTLAVSMADDGTLYTVPAGGGELTVFFELPDTIGVSVHHLDLLPDGALLATVGRASGADAVGVIAEGTFTALLEANGIRRPRYAPSGHIIYERTSGDPSLWGVAFAAGGRKVTGEPFVIGRGRDPSIARDGTLVYRAEGEELTRRSSSGSRRAVNAPRASSRFRPTPASPAVAPDAGCSPDVRRPACSRSVRRRQGTTIRGQTFPAKPRRR